MFWFETAHPETGEALEVEAVYCAPWRGLRDGYGAPLEPDDEEAVRICGVRNRDGDAVEFAAFQTALEEAGFAFAREKR
ncbi:MAG: hypothetical protein WCI40_00880 [Verrucomicrobiota bacterium]